jgi:SAM-dependent methyltransferase
MYSHGWTYGVWYTGKGFTKNKLHGQYPPTFLKRALALWPDVPESRCLHVCAGTVQHGVRVDLSPRFGPSVLANAEQLPFRDGSFDLVLYDPPYDKKNAEIYGVAPKPPRWPHVMQEMARVLTPGGHIAILHWYYPSYSRRKMGVKLVGLIAVCVGFCSMTRMFSVFEKTGVSPMTEVPHRVNGRFAKPQRPLFESPPAADAEDWNSEEMPRVTPRV